MYFFVSFLIVGTLVTADQLIKLWAITDLQQKITIPIIHKILSLTYAENTGGAFSFFSNGQIFFIIFISLVLILCIWYYIRRRPRAFFERAAFLLLMAGGMGNLIDRIFRGFVVDYIEFTFVRFAIFNLADMCVVGGCIAVIIAVLLNPKLFDKI